jgi:cytidine deaminase
VAIKIVVNAAIPLEKFHLSSLAQNGKIITANMMENNSGTITISK